MKEFFALLSLLTFLIVTPVIADNYDRANSESATSRNASGGDNTFNMNEGTDQGHKITPASGESDDSHSVFN